MEKEKELKILYFLLYLGSFVFLILGLIYLFSWINFRNNEILILMEPLLIQKTFYIMIIDLVVSISLFLIGFFIHKKSRSN
jgi:hypothetical protein